MIIVSRYPVQINALPDSATKCSLYGNITTTTYVCPQGFHWWQRCWLRVTPGPWDWWSEAHVHRLWSCSPPLCPECCSHQASSDNSVKQSHNLKKSRRVVWSYLDFLIISSRLVNDLLFSSRSSLSPNPSTLKFLELFLVHRHREMALYRSVNKIVHQRCEWAVETASETQDTPHSWILTYYLLDDLQASSCTDRPCAVQCITP